jgi:hypothetical protein
VPELAAVPNNADFIRLELPYRFGDFHFHLATAVVTAPIGMVFSICIGDRIAALLAGIANARALLKFLTAPEAAAIIRKTGIEPG